MKRWIPLLVVVPCGLLTAEAEAHHRHRQASRTKRVDRASAARIAWVARAYQRGRYRRLVRRDCSGLVISILGRAGLKRSGGTKHFWYRAVREGRLTRKPRPGDLAFFDRTYDANRNGRVDDRLTHIAVVTRVHADGTVEMVHRSSRGVRRLRLNLKHRNRHRVGHKVVNDYLRSRRYGKRNAPRLAGQLLRGFARV